MKRRTFIAAAASIAVATFVLRPRDGVRLKPLVTDPEQREFVYADGWITMVT